MKRGKGRGAVLEQGLCGQFCCLDNMQRERTRANRMDIGCSFRATGHAIVSAVSYGGDMECSERKRERERERERERGGGLKNVDR